MAFSRKLDKSRLCHAERSEASLLRYERLFGRGKTLPQSDMILVLEKTMPGGFPYLFAEAENIYTLHTVL
jgi:hypothetical protein